MDKTIEMRRLLRENGIEPTRPRLRIANAILLKHQHLTARNVMDRVNHDDSKDVSISRATVYNTLNLFVHKGLVQLVSMNLQSEGSRLYYDSNVSPHSHLYNESTGELMDLPQGQDGALSALPPMVQVQRVEVFIVGKNVSGTEV